jgi:hypothetical protein
MLMFITTGWGEDATIAAVISYAIFYGGFGQMVAGVFEVRTMQLQVPCQRSSSLHGPLVARFDFAKRLSRFQLSVTTCLQRYLDSLPLPGVVWRNVSCAYQVCLHCCRSSLCTADQGQHLCRNSLLLIW